MKTSIKSVLATGLLAIALSSSSVYADVVKPLTISSSRVDITSIKKLIISGNVEVTVTQDPKSKVLYTNENGGYVSVKKVGDALIINGKHNLEVTKITVYVNDIYRIDASGSSNVKATEVLNLKYLQVFLRDSAKVDLNSNTESLFTTIKNNAELNLKGSTDAYTIEMDKTSKITLDKFVSKKTDMMNSSVYVAARK